MLTLRQRLFIIVGLVVGILVAILLFLNYRRNVNNLPTADTYVSSQAGDTTDPGGDIVVDKVGTATNTEVPVVPYSDDVYVRQLAKIFVERFSSFSSQSDNGQITDTLDLATPEMQAWMKTQMKTDSKDYEGVVTTVLATKVLEKTVRTASVAVEVQQSLEKKSAEVVGSVTRDQRIRRGKVTLVQNGNTWLVDGLYWDKE